MGLDTRAGDWEFVGLSQVSLAFVAGGGAYYFKFRSRAAGVDEGVFFICGGLGVGWGAGQGAPWPDRSGRIPYSRIHCMNTFSMADLDNSMGNLQSVGAAVIIGYSALYVAAFNFSNGVLFDNAGGYGWTGGGLQASANSFVGGWRVMKLANQAMARAVHDAFR